MLTLANFIKGAIQDELDQVFQAIAKKDVSDRKVTRSALSQARRKISHTVFIALKDAICRFLEQHAPLRTYKGMRALALDGSTLRLPNLAALREHFGQVKTKTGTRAMARLSLLHDVLNRVTYDAIIGSYHQGELSMALEHLEDAPLPDRCLFLMDRGYVSFYLLGPILDQGQHFCVRAKNSLKVVKQFLQSGQGQGIYQFRPPKNLRQQIGGDNPILVPITVRLIRLKQGKKTIVLMTSLLDTREYPAEDIADLYRQRWQVEESYKVKKCRMMLEDFSGLTPEIILQDFHAKVFAECLTSALILDVDDQVEAYNLRTKHEYKVSITACVAKMKNTLVLLFMRRSPVPILGALRRLFVKCLVAMVPGRRFARKNEGKCAAKLQISSMGYRKNR